MQHRSMPDILPRLCVVTCIWFLAEVLQVRETTYGWCLRTGPVTGSIVLTLAMAACRSRMLGRTTTGW